MVHSHIWINLSKDDHHFLTSSYGRSSHRLHRKFPKKNMVADENNDS